MALRIMTEPQNGATYDQLTTLAQAAERLGFAAFFRSDHYLKIEAPSETVTVTDAWISLAGIARDTSTIRLGTMVTPVTFRGIGAMTVTLAQVDQMSGGRVEVGLGAGWFDQEHEAFGLPFPPVGTRMDLLDDQLSILTGVWNTPPGGTFRLDGATTSIAIDADTVRPFQTPGPPLILGGWGKPRSSLLAAAYGDEYNVPFASVEDTKAAHDNVREACERSGRDPGDMVYSAAQTICCGTNDADLNRRAAAMGREVDAVRQHGLGGSPAEVLEKLAAYAEAGVERFYLQVLDVTDLDHLALVAAEVLPSAPGS